MHKLEYKLSTYPFHIDSMGHVNNIIYIQWMEIGRVNLLNAVDMPIETMTKAGVGPVLTETHISYKVPLYLGDMVTGSIWVSELRSASATLSFEFHNQHGNLAAVGTQRGLFIDLTSKKPKRLTSDQRERFAAHLILAEP